jgi:thiosulfate/3-mercaptopyruvate sulfurtransferase
LNTSKSILGLLFKFASILVLVALIWLSYNPIAGSFEGFIEKSTAKLDKSDEFEHMLMPISDVSSSDLLLDVSMNSTSHIQDSILIPYTDFMINGGYKPLPDLIQILSDAGICMNDSIVIYGECMPCGGGPAPSTYIYFMMKCLGHENIKVLDATVEDLIDAGLPTTNKSKINLKSNYTPLFSSELIASYDYVMSGKAEIIDARSFKEFNVGSIPGAINIPSDRVIFNGKIKNETALNEIFGAISKDKPVVVFTNDAIKASVVWFALKMLDYDAKLYTWRDWLANHGRHGISIEKPEEL